MVSLSAIKKRPAPQQVYPMGWEFLVFANLVADCARGLASRLARGLAFAATASLQGFLKLLCADGFNVFGHFPYPFQDYFLPNYYSMACSE